MPTGRDVRASSSDLANYLSNRFLIEAACAERLLVAGGDNEFSLATGKLHLFVHEYWHYWHNFSTRSGLTGFSISRDLQRCFSPTLDATFGSQGSAHLRPESRQSIEAMLQEKEALVGGSFPPPWKRMEKLIKWASLRNDFVLPIEVAVGPRTVTLERQIIELDLLSESGAAITLGGMVLGEFALDESIAFLVERQVARAEGVEVKGPIPLFPYRLGEILFQSITNRPQKDGDADYVARLATLALLRPDPGRAYLQLLRALKAWLDTGRCIESAFRAVQASEADSLRRSLQELCDHRTPSIFSREPQPGVAAEAVSYFLSLSTHAIRNRLGDFTLGLDVFFPQFDEPKFRDHFRAFPACNAVQRNPGDEWDTMHSFEPGDANRLDSPTTYMRILHSQEAFASSHRVRGSLEYKSSCSLVEPACPYVAACYPRRLLPDPNDCKAKPWTRAMLEKPCWFGIGVKSFQEAVTLIAAHPQPIPTASSDTD